jgi:hypothetical protein
MLYSIYYIANNNYLEKFNLKQNGGRSFECRNFLGIYTLEVSDDKEHWVFKLKDVYGSEFFKHRIQKYESNDEEVTLQDRQKPFEYREYKHLDEARNYFDDVFTNFKNYIMLVYKTRKLCKL